MFKRFDAQNCVWKIRTRPSTMMKFKVLNSIMKYLKIDTLNETTKLK